MSLFDERRQPTFDELLDLGNRIDERVRFVEERTWADRVVDVAALAVGVVLGCVFVKGLLAWRGIDLP